MDQNLDITKEIVIAMINKGAFTFYNASNEEDIDTPTHHAKAVAAAFETVYAGLVQTIKTKR